MNEDAGGGVDVGVDSGVDAGVDDGVDAGVDVLVGVGVGLIPQAWRQELYCPIFIKTAIPGVLESVIR